MNRSIKISALAVGAILGIVHLFVDLATVSTAFVVSRKFGVSPLCGVSIILLYDILAFLGQAVIGWLSDRQAVYRHTALFGIALVTLSVVLLPFSSWASLLCAGIGNASFHVGAGAASLCMASGRATIPGVFVAPGAIGLGLGTLLGKSGVHFEWPVIAALLVALGVVWKIHMPLSSPRPKTLMMKSSRSLLVIFALLASIVIRSLVGFGGSSSCVKTIELKVALLTVAAFGKGLGGIVADKLGWIRASVMALLVSAPLISFFGSQPIFLVLGFLVFQMTMPVTLVAISEVLPGRPGLSFGICCVALLIGALLSFSQTVQSVYSSSFFMGLILLSAALVFWGLTAIKPHIKMKF